ncbi:ABC transporter permease, partial [Pseudomonas tolaasii]
MSTLVKPGNGVAPAATKINGPAVLGWVLHNVVWIWLIALVAGFGLFNEFFFTLFNLQNVMVQATVLGMLGLAVALPLLVAEIDLSIPANAGFSSAVGALAYSSWGLPWYLAVIIGLLVGTAIGFFNGLCITRLKMVSLIETLAMMIILQGALLALTQGTTLTNMADGYIWIGQVTLGGWPLMPVVFLVALVVMGVV